MVVIPVAVAIIPVAMVVIAVVVIPVAVAIIPVAMVVAVIIFALDADKGDFGRLAGHIPMPYHFQIVGVQRNHFPGAGVGDKNAPRRSGNMRPRPKAGIDGIGKNVRCGCQQVGIVGIVHPHFAVAHHRQQQFAVIAEGNLYRTQSLGGGNKLLHRTHFRLHQIQADARTQRKEMVQPLIAPHRSQPEILRRAGRRRDESVGIFAIMRLNHQGPAGAAEHRHMAVAGIAVQIGAFCGGGVQRHPVPIADGNALRQAIILRAGRIVRVLHRYGENIPLQRHCRAVMRAGVNLARNIAVPVVLQFVFVDQRHIARAVVVNGDPFVGDVQMHRIVARQVNIQPAHGLFHPFQMGAVFLHIDAAVKDMGGVGVGGHGNGVASAANGVDAAGAGAHIKGILHHRPGFQVNDRQLAAFAVAHQQPAVRHRIMVIIAVVVMVIVVVGREWQFHQLLRLQPFGCHHYHGVGRRGVGNQIFHLRRQPAAVADDDSGFGNPHTVLRGALPGMGVASGGNQVVDVNQLAAHLPRQVGQHGIAGNHIERLGVDGRHAGRRGRGLTLRLGLGLILRLGRGLGLGLSLSLNLVLILILGLG